MHRLRMPAAFIALIEDSLTGLSSCIRTAFGFTRRFDVLRSLRQGDPLAPLLFVILMDALHEGLECNPFTGEQHGLVLKLKDGHSVSIPSLGYADDTTVLTNSLESMRIQNDWVHYFMRFNLLGLNHSKCELVGRFEDELPAVTAADLQVHGITIEGNSIEPVPHDQPIRYLGVHCRFDGSWHAQHLKSLGMVHKFASVVRKFDVSLSQARYMFNVFLMPKLELALHYVHGPGTRKLVRSCNSILVGCIKHAVKSPLQLSHRAVAHALGLILPSRLEVAVKVSELFLRINSLRPDCRWGQLGRLLMREALPSVVDSTTHSLPRDSNDTRWTRAARLTVKLGWSLRLLDDRTDRRNPHLFETEPAPARDMSVGVITQNVGLTGSAVPVTITHDRWQGWGADAPAIAAPVHVYTDGSFDAHSNTSSWAVTVGDKWFDESIAAIPSDEKLLQAVHVRGATMLGASIRCTQGVYPAELQAIARVLAMFPLSCPLHVHSDSESSLSAIHSFISQCNERRRLRMAGRPLLQLIHHLLDRRTADTTLSHVKAHTDGVDAHSVGNRLSDYQANLSRAQSARSSPPNLSQLPLDKCEHHMVITDSSGLVISDDIRRSAMKQLKSAELSYWRGLAGDIAQGTLACEAMVELGRAMLESGNSTHQSTFVHVATNTIHCYWAADGMLTQLHCRDCDEIRSLSHLFDCPTSFAFRWELAIAIRNCFGIEAAAHDWLQDTRLYGLRDLFASLFPVSATASEQEQQRHFTCLLVGAFTRRQANAAAKSAGFAPGEEGRDCLLRLRLLCLGHIAKTFGRWKEAACA